MTPLSACRWALPGLAVLLGWFALPLMAASPPVAAKGSRTATLQCEAVYLPARTTWPRRVDIGFDQQRVRTVHIDGVPVYTFSIRGTVIMTALDNERIQIDTASQTWTSDFRGLATAQGRCERTDLKP
jgi:FlaG/FlaF family flagellin (archaellin)